MNDNVIKFPGTDYEIKENPLAVLEEYFGKKVEVSHLLDTVINKEFDDVIVIGRYEDRDGIYFASSTGNPEKITWDLERARTLISLSYYRDADDALLDDED